MQADIPMKWIALCVTTSFLVFCAASFLAGLNNVSPQLLLPLVGDLAPPERRGTCIAIVASGTTLGVLVARVSSGFLTSVPEPDSGALSKVGSWRAVYWFGLGMQCLFVVLLWIWMPDYPRKNTASGVLEGEGGDHRRDDDNEKDESVEQFENARGDENIVSGQTDQPPAPGKDQCQRGWLPCCCFWLVTYLRLLVDTIRLLPTEPLLAQAAAVAFLLSAVLGSFWSTLSFLLSGPPYNYSNTIIGLFGLLGLVGAILGPAYGRLVVDRFVPLIAALPGLLLGISGAAVGTFLGERHIAGPAVQAAATDFGTQVTQIAYRSVMYDVRPNQPNRVNTAYMLVSYMGQMTGSAVGNRLYTRGGWKYSGICSRMSHLVTAVKCSETVVANVICGSCLPWPGVGRMPFEGSEGDGMDRVVRRMEDTTRSTCKETKVGWDASP
jgi:predicted MFS family arabinose efflux permease